MKTDDSDLTGLEAVKAIAEQWRRDALVSVDNPGCLTGKDLTQVLTYVQTCDRFAALCEEQLERGDRTVRVLRSLAEKAINEWDEACKLEDRAKNDVDHYMAAGRVVAYSEMLDTINSILPAAFRVRHVKDGQGTDNAD